MQLVPIEHHDRASACPEGYGRNTVGKDLDLTLDGKELVLHNRRLIQNREKA